MVREEEKNDAEDEIILEPDLSIPYRKLRQLLPGISEDKWLELKDLALDNTMKKFAEFIGQLRRHRQIEPEFVIKIGALVTVLEHLMDVFKVQRIIIEELKEAVSKKE